MSRILFITHTASLMGANRSMLDLIDGLLQKGHHCSVLLPEAGLLTEKLHLRSVPVFICPFLNWYYTKVSPSYWFFPLIKSKNRQYLAAITETLKNVSFDIVHSNSSIFMTGAYIADYFKKPHVWHIREMMELHYQTKNLLGEKAFQKWMNKADFIIPISKEVENQVLGAISTPRKVIFDAVFTEKQLDSIASQKMSDKKEVITFLMVGLIHPMKKQMEGLKAFHQLHEKHKHIRLVIVGNGRRIYTQQLKNYAKLHRLSSKVHFTGYVSDPSTYYQEADIFLMPSRHEAMGRVTVEALAHGLIVIASKSGGNPEIITHQQNGLLYDNSVKSLYYWMQWAVDNLKNISQPYRSAGQQTVKEHFLVKDYTQKIISIYKYVAQNYTPSSKP